MQHTNDSQSTIPDATHHPTTQPLSPHPQQQLQQLPPFTWRSRLLRIASTVKHHFTNHVGAGLIASVAYFDPGNWSVDLSAGSQYGYKLLFVVLLSGLFAVVLQAMATKLGCVTGFDLAQQCRIHLHNHPKHPKLVRWLVLYPLYILSEVAIVATDLAELLGSAIALVLLIPSVPLYAAVLITAADVFVILLFTDKGKSQRPVKLFEFTIILLVLIVFICFIVLIVRVRPQWGPVMAGFLPSKQLVENNALYVCIGILGATVMPHALFLGSSLATQDRVAEKELPLPGGSDALRRKSLKQYITSMFATEKVTAQDGVSSSSPNRLLFVKRHLRHGIVDIVMSLLCLAVLINSSILILAGDVFFVEEGSKASQNPASLFDAYDLIHVRLGKAAAIIFAVALLCAGQSASITSTLCGSIVSEGFIHWRMSPFLTRLTTRMMALVPATIVAAVVGKEGINSLLVASQVVLSLILPFVVFPLVYFTSNSRIMTVSGEPVKEGESTSTVDYRNGVVLKYVGYIIFVIIVVANISALVTLIGQSQ